MAKRSVVIAVRVCLVAAFAQPAAAAPLDVYCRFRRRLRAVQLLRNCAAASIRRTHLHRGRRDPQRVRKLLGARLLTIEFLAFNCTTYAVAPETSTFPRGSSTSRSGDWRPFRRRLRSRSRTDSVPSRKPSCCHWRLSRRRTPGHGRRCRGRVRTLSITPLGESACVFVLVDESAIGHIDKRSQLVVYRLGGGLSRKSGGTGIRTLGACAQRFARPIAACGAYATKSVDLRTSLQLARHCPVSRHLAAWAPPGAWRANACRSPHRLAGMPELDTHGKKFPHQLLLHADLAPALELSVAYSYPHSHPPLPETRVFVELSDAPDDITSAFVRLAPRALQPLTSHMNRRGFHMRSCRPSVCLHRVRRPSAGHSN